MSPRRAPAPAPATATDDPGAGWYRALGAGGLEALARAHGTPAYVYSADVLRARCGALRAAFPRAAIRYALKANANPAVVGLLRACGLGIDAVSHWEVRLARELGFAAREVIYSGNNPSDEELLAVCRAGVVPNIDALSALERLGRLRPGARVSLRLNLEIGDGHHPHVVTAGPDSKFGLAREDLPAAHAIARRHKLRVIGLHQHIGSGLFDQELYLRALAPLFALVPEFPELTFVDIGGGFGVPYRRGEPALDLAGWGRAVGEIHRALEASLGREVALLIEPGRYVVAEAGILLTRVTTVKTTRDRTFIGVDSGMHHLIRPALYGAHHEVAFFPERSGATARCHVVGPICESGDVLAEERAMVPAREGDLVVVENAGAYGFVMASHYNLRARPAEVLVGDGRTRRVRARETYRDVIRAHDLPRRSRRG